jgi:hypothetical protein
MGTSCADSGGPPRAHIGHPCTSDVDCPGLFCSTAGNGFGYCSWVCNAGMACPDDAVCHVFTPGSVGYCMERCDPANPMSCASGYLCEPGIAEAPVCYPGCSTAMDCPAGDQCGMGLAGVRSCYAPAAMIGAACTMSSQCPEAGYCLDENSWGTPHGLCVTFCDLASHAGCGAGTTCVAWGFTGGGAAYGSCIPTCDAMSPCRAGYECVSTGSGGPSACVARCMNDGDCTAPHTCNFVTGRCG